MKTLEKLYQLYLQSPNICTDSRSVKKGDLFFALKGANFNGNKYAAQALEKGAIVAIVDEAEFALDERFVLVEDVLKMLQNLARHHRRQFYIPILAITGSNGKTTTKELISAVLSSHYPTHFTKGNFNNHIGVPLTLLEMPLDTEIAVIEMGANHLKEIDFLCRIAEPSHGLITNIGKAHLEGFGGLEGVKQAKSELYRYLEERKGILFVNKDENHLSELVGDMPRVVWYMKSEHPKVDVVPYEIVLEKSKPFVKASFLSASGELFTAQSQLIGDYNFNNIKTAIAIGKYFKVPATKIKRAIENYIPSNNRSQIVEKGRNTFILDAYNANPTSMNHALKNLREIEHPNKIAILGDMLELGNFSQAEHQAILQQAVSLNLEKVITVGKEFGKIKKSDYLHFLDVNALIDWWEKQNYQDRYILIKGSRGIGLEKLVFNIDFIN